MPKLKPLLLGPLPVDAINAALGLDLDPGNAFMTVLAQQHAKRRHPQDFPLYLPMVGEVINRPLYGRDDFKNDGKIELIARPPGCPEWLLVAVVLEPDLEGHYHIASFYPISQNKVDRRRERGHLKRIVIF